MAADFYSGRAGVSLRHSSSFQSRLAPILFLYSKNLVFHINIAYIYFYFCSSKVFVHDFRRCFEALEWPFIVFLRFFVFLGALTLQ